MPTNDLDFVPTDISESAHGVLIQVTGTTTGTSVTVFTAVAAIADVWDSFYMAICNNHNDDVLVTIEWTAAGAANEIKIVLPAFSGFWPVIPMHRLRNTHTVKVFADVANVINVHVERERLRGTLTA